MTYITSVTQTLNFIDTLVEKRVSYILNRGDCFFNGLNGFEDSFNVLFPQKFRFCFCGAMDEGEVSLGIWSYRWEFK